MFFLCDCFSIRNGCSRGVSRLLYVIGRDGCFPTKFLATCIQNGDAPILNMVFVNIVALSAVTFDLVTATVLINLGVLIAYTFVNLWIIFSFIIMKSAIEVYLIFSIILFYLD